MARKKMTNEEFLKKIPKSQKEKYVFSKTDIDKCDEKRRIIITCPKHGDFLINMYNFINGEGCPKCGAERRKAAKSETFEECVKKCKKAHGDKYIYPSNQKYLGSHSKIRIICPEHGEFFQTAIKHWNGQGCPRCSKTVNDVKTFIEKAKEVHGDKYDYSNVFYKSSHEKVLIKCKICGNIFEQTPMSHIRGCGCPFCKSSHLENEVENALDINKIKYIRQYSNKDLKRLKIDFYLPEYKIGIECQGRQHFKPYSFFGGKNTFEKLRERDIRKKKLCEKDNIKLLYFTHENDNSFLNEELIKDTNNLIKIITNING